MPKSLAAALDYALSAAGWVKDHPRTYSFVLGLAAGWWWL